MAKYIEYYNQKIDSILLIRDDIDVYSLPISKKNKKNIPKMKTGIIRELDSNEEIFVGVREK